MNQIARWRRPLEVGCPDPRQCVVRRGFDFAAGQLPGWHATIFPPYFVAGAIFAGFAMVLTLAIPLRAIFGLKDFITLRHIQNMAKVMLATGLIVAYGYLIEIFMAWYSGNWFEQFMILNRITGPYRWTWYALILCNVLAPQLIWVKKVRTTPWMIFIVAIFVNVGMWLERFVIVVTSLHRDFLPSSWDYYRPTLIDVLTLIGSFGLFFTLFLLFLRFLPMVAMSEVKAVMPQADPHLQQAPQPSGGAGD